MGTEVMIITRSNNLELNNVT